MEEASFGDGRRLAPRNRCLTEDEAGNSVILLNNSRAQLFERLGPMRGTRAVVDGRASFAGWDNLARLHEMR